MYGKTAYAWTHSLHTFHINKHNFFKTRISVQLNNSLHENICGRLLYLGGIRFLTFTVTGSLHLNIH